MKSDEINETNEMNNEMHNEIETELSLAWEDITSNKNAINVIDKNVEGITSDIKNISEKQEENTRKHEEEILKLEKKYDAKLVVFMATYKEQFDKDIINTKEQFEKLINCNMQDIIGKFKLSVQQQLNEFTKLKDEWKRNYDEWTCNSAEKEENSKDNHINELKQSIEFNFKEIEDLKNECKTAMTKLSQIIKNYDRLYIAVS